MKSIKPKKFSTANVLLAMLMLPVTVASMAAAQPVEYGIEPVSVNINAQVDNQALNPNDKIIVPTDHEVRLSIIYKSTLNGVSRYIIRAPFAKSIMTSVGTINEDNGVWILELSASRGQFFTLYFIGTVTEASYIDIFKATGSTIDTVNHFPLVPITGLVASSKQTAVTVSTSNKLDPQIAIAEDNLNKLRKLGKEFPLLESELENAKLYSTQQNYEKAGPLLDDIITQTSQTLDHYNSLKDRIEAIKEKAANSGTLKKVSPFLVSAERALKTMDLSGAEKHISDAEKIAYPSWFNATLDSYGTYFWILFFGLIVLLGFKWFKSSRTPIKI